MLEKMK
jgi:hypothetical protein